MDKTTVGLLGALVAGTQAQAAMPAAAPHDVLQAASYSELLKPIPNALETLKALDAQEPAVQDVQYYPYYYAPPPVYYYRHHHHHHRYYQRYYHHHHHHHHHNNYWRR